jgi:hypothetical protein
VRKSLKAKTATFSKPHTGSFNKNAMLLARSMAFLLKGIIQ